MSSLGSQLLLIVFNLEVYHGIISNRNTRSKFRNISPVQFDIDHTKHTQLSEEVEDEYGYIDRITGISKDYFDHGDPNVQCQKCGAMLWLAESQRGANIAGNNECFSLCCGKGKVKLPVALKDPPPLLRKLMNGEHRRTRASVIVVLIKKLGKERQQASCKKLPGENKSLGLLGLLRRNSAMYCEERPLLLVKPGMGAGLCTCYQKVNRAGAPLGHGRAFQNEVSTLHEDKVEFPKSAVVYENEIVASDIHDQNWENIIIYDNSPDVSETSGGIGVSDTNWMRKIM
ncbi:hypothetical protein Tco_0898434, partial [Tanacetum coccineum]